MRQGRTNNPERGCNSAHCCCGHIGETEKKNIEHIFQGPFSNVLSLSSPREPLFWQDSHFIRGELIKSS